MLELKTNWVIRIALVILSIAGRQISSYAQWLDGGRPQSEENVLNGMLYPYEGKLMFWNYEDHCQVSYDNGNTWVKRSDTMKSTFPWVTRMSYSQGRLYAAVNISRWDGGNYGGSVVVYTTDDGISWIPDTAGAVFYSDDFPWIPALRDLRTFGQWVYISRDRHDPNSHMIKAFDGPFELNEFINQAGNIPQAVDTHGDTLFVASKKFYFTADGGKTFTVSAGSGYPGNVRLLVRDRDRLYAFAQSVTDTFEQLYYTDNAGHNWERIDISALTSRNMEYDQSYRVQTAFIRDSLILYAAPGRDSVDKGYCPANVWRSPNLGRTWERDTAGLPTIYNEFVINFALGPDSTLWCVNNHYNIYRQKIKATNADVGSVVPQRTTVSIYPNPSHEQVRVDIPDDALTPIRIYDMLGRFVRLEEITAGMQSTEINLTGIPPGGYRLIVQQQNGSFSSVAIMVY